MSLIVALRGKDELVFAADTLGWEGVKEGYYKFSAKKLRAIGGNWISGTAGTGVGADLQAQLAAEGECWEEDIDLGAPAYAVRTLKLYQHRGYAGETSFLVGGFHQDSPVIYRWSLPEFAGAVRCRTGRAAIGIGEHGAMHFSAAYHRESMTTEQRILLAYFCIFETTRQDPRVGTPIDIAVVRRRGITWSTERDLVGFRRECESLSNYIAGRFASTLVNPDPLLMC